MVTILLMNNAYELHDPNSANAAYWKHIQLESVLINLMHLLNFISL